MTEKLYWQDPFMSAFEAEVIEHIDGERPAMVLDRSAFYPESGGQMADRGNLGGVPLVDVQLDDAGRILHFLDGPLPEIGSRVRGELDFGRRRIHMAQHTGQHMLSRALLEVAGADTVSSRLGETACTLDTDLAKLEERQLERAEALTNAIIEDDVSVQALHPSEQELKSLSLRRESKVEQNVRVVKIGDFDVTPCGGTHCTRSAQVGLMRITGLERYKRGWRITFMAGSRARAKLTRDSELLASLAQRFSCGPSEVQAAVAKLERQASRSRRELSALRERLAGELCARLSQRPAEELLVMAFDDLDASVVRALAAALCRLPGRAVALAACSADGCQVVLARSSDRELDCGALMRAVAKASGGRGGGRAERAEGKLPAGIDWPQLVATARAAM